MRIATPTGRAALPQLPQTSLLPFSVSARRFQRRRLCCLFHHRCHRRHHRLRAGRLLEGDFTALRLRCLRSHRPSPLAARVASTTTHGKTHYGGKRAAATAVVHRCRGFHMSQHCRRCTPLQETNVLLLCDSYYYYHYYCFPDNCKTCLFFFLLMDLSLHVFFFLRFSNLL